MSYLAFINRRLLAVIENRLLMLQLISNVIISKCMLIHIPPGPGTYGDDLTDAYRPVILD